MRKLFLLLSVGVLVAASACANGYSAAAPSPTPGPAPSPSGGGTPVSIPVGAETLGNRAFAPDQVEVAVGGTVTWTNTDSVSHTTTSDQGRWDSGAVAPGGQFSSTYATAGTFPYHCAIHPGMVGTITVR
jgi:plastocyanin